MRNVVVAILFGCLGLFPLQAESEQIDRDPVQVLQTTLNQVVEILANPDLDLATKEVRINRLVTPIFDFSLMSYLTLGKSQWAKMTPEQKIRFTDLFVERLKDSYRDKLSMYSGERLAFQEATYKGNKAQVPTELLASEKKISVLYLMHNKKDKGWRIYDLEIQGVSIIRTYRSQFTEVLSKGTIDDLLAQLEKPLTEEVPAPSAN